MLAWVKFARAALLTGGNRANAAQHSRVTRQPGRATAKMELIRHPLLVMNAVLSSYNSAAEATNTSVIAYAHTLVYMQHVSGCIQI